ncbi:hypothetical protein DIPPA_22762 [Diplonema papillatum]|nr:hypothetical protein DIPPA_22762 [Diplonema papillatum]
MIRRTAVVCMKVNASVSTADLYAASHGNFTKAFAKQRAELDYGYHSNYTFERQRLQDRIIESLIPQRKREESEENPWLVFSAGAMGAGKTRTLHWMAQQGHFPLNDFTFLDHDAIKYLLPEMWHYQLLNPKQAGTLTQKEAGFIVEIATRVCLDSGVNCLVDGSLRDHKWYEKHITDIRSEKSETRVGIVHVYADESCVYERARHRAEITGRHIPSNVLKAALRSVPQSVEALTPSVDSVVTIDNSGALPPRLDSLVFPKQSRLRAAGLHVVLPPWEVISSLFSSTACHQSLRLASRPSSAASAAQA